MRFASVPLPDAAGPSMAMIMTQASAWTPPPGGGGTPTAAVEKGTTPSRRSLRHRVGRAQPLHQRAELGKAGGDNGRVVDGDGPVGAEAERQEGHGDAVIQMGGH